MKQLVFIITLLMSCNAFSGIIRSAVSATTTNERASINFITATIDQSGLQFEDGVTAGYESGLEDFDTVTSTLFHSFAAFPDSLEWFTEVGVTSATVTYDLGDVYTLDAVALWVEEGSAPHSDVTFSSSTDGTTYTSLFEDLTLPKNDFFTAYPATVYDFGPTATRFFQIDFGSCFRIGCSLGEIAFSEVGTITGGGGSGSSGSGGGSGSDGGGSGSGSDGGTGGDGSTGGDIGGGVIPVSEPSSLSLLAIGFFALLLRRKRLI